MHTAGVSYKTCVRICVKGDGGLCNRSDSIGRSDQELQLGVFLWLSQDDDAPHID